MCEGTDDHSKSHSHSEEPGLQESHYVHHVVDSATGCSLPQVKKNSKRHLPSQTAATPSPKKPPDLQVFDKPPDPECPDQKPLKLEVDLPKEPPADIPTEKQDLPASEHQPEPEPQNEQHQNHTPPVPAPEKLGDGTPQETNPEETIACCASCQGQFPGVMLPSQRRCRWLCPDCRAQRRDFNREQRYYKQIGCGVCQACQMSQDCGICSVCVLRARDPEVCTGVKCLLRRCLRIVKKGLECGMCQACKIMEDCGSCVICLRRHKPGMKRQWKCVKRRCLKRKKKILPKKDGYNSKKLTVEAASAKDAPTPVRRRQKKATPAKDGLPTKAQRGPRQRRKKLSETDPLAVATVSEDGPPPKALLVSGSRRRKRSATTKWKPTSEQETEDVPVVKHGHAPKRRRCRKCGKCEACLLKRDCGRCDFCCDKPKFGGQNMKRQKCRWRQCLQLAMKRLLPEEWSSPEAAGSAVAGWKVRRRRRRTVFGGHSRKPVRIKQVGRRGAKGSGQKQKAKASFQPEESSSTSEMAHPPKSCSPQTSQQWQQEQQLVPLSLKNKPEAAGFPVTGTPVKDHPILPESVTEAPEVPFHPTPPAWIVGKESDTRLPPVNPLLATSPKIKQDHVEPGGDRRPSNDSPVSAGLPQFKRPQGPQSTEVVILDDEDDDEVEQPQQIRPPVIMEIYSLGDMQPLAQLDSVLHEFLAELNEIPLPAHWEVLPPLGSPNLRLVQRSKHSTMSAAVIYIRPGLFFHVVVQDMPVPPEHELYASHPARLTTVDEVVELICDLEAYRLCPGWPAGWHAGERSEACDVLVYSGCCPQCRLNPWPSGSGAC
ncbi:methyl-CpG-binding domain protein 1 [Sceloporus undulatus]|uniref:methyl-CpG-binding domain protein 1 n=1 Tax=Sceloporus undulatus TaxID=8520 RepID=UPI001C4B33E2|nr:methyl-CpG-binding domain protein 1 [Sceloporus undulatus]